MKGRILELLKNTKDYVSGQELCEKFGVSRTAVWKAVNSLKESGYMIESVPNRGYRLVECPDVLFSEELKSILKTKWFGRRILYYQDIDSTNNEVKRQADANEEGLLVIAEHQSAGRGRRGRAWESPAQSGIWMSFLLKPDMMPDKASMLTLVVALACARAIQREISADVGIKWPNDIVINGRKAVGILTEMSAEPDFINYVVVGIGINANTDEFPDDISAVATSLKKECGHSVQRSRIVAAVGEEFEPVYERFLKDGDLRGLRAEYEGLLVNKNAQVCILNGDERRVCTALGINDMGELVVRHSDGSTEEVRAGEVSVRGIYGYV